MSEAKIIRFPLKDVNLVKSAAVEKELVDINSINELPEIEKPEEIFSIPAKELETIKQKAFQEGYDKSQAEKTNEASQQETALSFKLSGVITKIEELDKIHYNSLKDLALESANLSIKIAQKLMGEVSNIQEHRIFRFFDEVLEKIKNESSITIYLEPTLAETLTPKINEMVSSKNIKSSVKVLPNDKLSDGQCTIDWNQGKAILNTENLLNLLQVETSTPQPDAIQNENLQNLS